ncbi:hypothetical protein [Natrononativus amylolyticus]|uniref:hypothetical protein n=1 Tax=Natrononativus amylolyticus TaxID=2963434 RepID=UPI0020CFAAF4|nr:hypothetical protein [Natrononativus amylolyticus]
MSEDSLKTNYWNAVNLKSVTKDGFSRLTSHSHRGELTKLRDEILDELDDLDLNTTEYFCAKDEHKEPEHPDSPDLSLIPRDLSHKIIALFSLSTGIMEKQTEMILRSEVISDEYKNTKIADSLLNTNLKTRLDLVKKLPVAAQFELSHAHDVRKTRNSLVHNPKKRLQIDDLANFKGRIKKTIRAPEELHKLQAELD